MSGHEGIIRQVRFRQAGTAARVLRALAPSILGNALARTRLVPKDLAETETKE
jgi:hypothetical protein